jgi:hypothetical protein
MTEVSCSHELPRPHPKQGGPPQLSSLIRVDGPPMHGVYHLGLWSSQLLELQGIQELVEVPASSCTL